MSLKTETLDASDFRGSELEGEGDSDFRGSEGRGRVSLISEAVKGGEGCL